MEEEEEQGLPHWIPLGTGEKTITGFSKEEKWNHSELDRWVHKSPWVLAIVCLSYNKYLVCPRWPDIGDGSGQRQR